VICHYDVEETLEHLFFECLATSSRWFALGISWTDSVNIFQKLTIAREASPHPFFMELFMIAANCIWVERNALIIEERAPSLGSWKASFKRESPFTCIESSLLCTLPFDLGSTACNLCLVCLR
jgi:hypothetical protein